MSSVGIKCPLKILEVVLSEELGYWIRSSFIDRLDISTFHRVDVTYILHEFTWMALILKVVCFW